MKKMRVMLSALLIPLAMGGSFLALAVPQTAYAEGTSGSCEGEGVFLVGFPAWYRGLMESDGIGGCRIKSSMQGDIGKIIWTVGLNVLDIALMAVGYISAGYVIYGGFLLMTSRGKPEYISEGQITVRNAIIGLTISFGSVAVVNFVFGGIIK